MKTSKREFAIIKPQDDGTHKVEFITMFKDPTEATMIAHNTWGNEAYVKETTYIDVYSPCIYKPDEDKFYNLVTYKEYGEDGQVTKEEAKEEEAAIIPTEKELLDKLTVQNAALISTLSNMIGGAKS